MTELRAALDNSILLVIYFPAIAAWLALLVRKPDRYAPGAIAMMATFAGIIASTFLAAQAFSNPISVRLEVPWPLPGVHLTFRADTLSVSMVTLSSLLFFVAVLLSCGLSARHNLRPHHFFCLLLASAAVNGVVLAGDLVTFYIFWELVWLNLLALLLTRLTALAIEATRKLMFLSVGTGVPLLFAVLWLSVNFGTTDMMRLWAIDRSASPGILDFAIVGFALTFALRIAIIPLHSWFLDGIVSAISPTGVILIAILGQVGFYSVMRVTFSVFQVEPTWHIALGVLGIASCVLGAIGAMQARSWKTSFAYLAIGQTGFVATALGVVAPLGDVAALFALVNLATYLPLALIAAEEVARTPMTDRSWQRLATLKPLAITSLSIGLAGVAGIPPVNGFGPRTLIFQALMAEDSYGSIALLVATFVATVLTTAAVLNFAFTIVRSEAETPAEARQPNRLARGPMLILAAASLGLGLVPQLILSDLIRPMVSVVRMIPVADVPLRGSTWISLGAAGLLVVAIAIGAAFCLSHLGLLRRLGQPYASAERVIISSIHLVAPLGRASAFLLDRGFLDAYVFARIIAGVLSTAAATIVFVTLRRHAPDVDAEWDYGEETEPTPLP